MLVLTADAVPAIGGWTGADSYLNQTHRPANWPRLRAPIRSDQFDRIRWFILKQAGRQLIETVRGVGCISRGCRHRQHHISTRTPRSLQARLLVTVLVLVNRGLGYGRAGLA